MLFRSKCSCRTVTEGNGIAETLTEATRRRVIIVEVYIVSETLTDKRRDYRKINVESLKCKYKYDELNFKS